MKTKTIKIIFSLLAITLFCFIATSPLWLKTVYAETEPPATIEGEEETPATGKVVIDASNKIDITTDITEGNVGDIVTITLKDNAFYVAKAIFINGTAIEAVDGVYSFALVEGDNIITSEYTINANSEEGKWLLDMINKAEEGDWASIFSLSNLAQIINWVIAGGGIIGLCITLLKMRKTKDKTAEDVEKAITKLLEEKYNIVITDLFKETLSPIFAKISDGITDVEEVCKVLARCMVLAQENTPEARMAIIAELTNLKSSDNDLIAQIKGLIDEELQNNKVAEEEKAKTLKELEEMNNSIGADSSSESVDVEEYGQI